MRIVTVLLDPSRLPFWWHALLVVAAALAIVGLVRHRGAWLTGVWVTAFGYFLGMAMSIARSSLYSLFGLTLACVGWSLVAPNVDA